MSKKKPDAPGMTEIREAAQVLAVAAQNLSLIAKTQEMELAKAIAPIAELYRPALDDAANDQAAALARLKELVDANPQLFRKPRSITIDGVRAGYRKEDDALDWSDEAAVIASIRKLLPDLAPTLVRTQETLVADAVAQLEPKDLQRLGIRRINGADKSFVTLGDSDVDRMVKAIVADAIARAGQDEKTASPKGKAKLKAKAEVGAS
ncbi:MAG: hypothetical protein JWL63_3240 [Rhodocyclales bacterium]|nr:hypothetical protein [Rhodocyclales bacterium]